MKTTALSQLIFSSLMQTTATTVQLVTEADVQKAEKELNEINAFLKHLKSTLAEVNDKLISSPDPKMTEPRNKITNLLFDLLRD